MLFINSTLKARHHPVDTIEGRYWWQDMIIVGDGYGDEGESEITAAFPKRCLLPDSRR